MEPMVTMALRAARKGADLIDKATQHHDIIPFEEKATNNFMTEVDKEQKSAIRLIEI
ncbi:MAG: hypothetical protein AAFZ92_00070 [Pseudomonadota bacterium]